MKNAMIEIADGLNCGGLQYQRLILAAHMGRCGAFWGGYGPWCGAWRLTSPPSRRSQMSNDRTDDLRITS